MLEGGDNLGIITNGRVPQPQSKSFSYCGAEEQSLKRHHEDPSCPLNRVLHKKHKTTLQEESAHNPHDLLPPENGRLGSRADTVWTVQAAQK